jgi:hypothetical protein
MANSLHRADGDTTTVDVAAWILDAPPTPAVVWPAVDALRRAGLLVRVQTSAGQSFYLPTPTAPIATAEQAFEKDAVALTTLSAPAEPAVWRTFTAATDLSLQSEASVSADAVSGMLASAVASSVDVAVLEALADGLTPEASVGAAIQAVGSWPGPRLVITSDPAGAADLAAMSDFSGGSITVVFDVFTTVNLVVAASGVAMVVVGPQRLDALRPSRLGRDITAAAYVLGPSIGTGAVATWAAP